MTDTESDYCDRIPGQHTGRLSLELQASEAAEWQERIDMLATRVRNLENEVAALKATPATPPAAAHGLSEHQLRAIGEAVTALRFCASQNGWYTEARATELRNIANALTGIEIDAAATPSAAVGASEPVAGDHKEWCDGAKEFCERQVESDTVPRAEYDRVLTLNHHLREVAVMAITERVPSDSKPTNCINPESEDTPPRGNDAPATGKPFQLEHGKQYLRRDGKVSGVMTQTKGGEYSVSHPLWDDFHCLSYRPDGRYNVSEAEDKFDLISEYHEPEPIPPAESEVDRLQRELDAAVEYHDNYTSKIDKALGQPRHGGDLLTEHLREIERLTYLPQTASPPAESPDDWVMITDPKHKIRREDQCRLSTCGNWAHCFNSVGDTIDFWPGYEFRCRRKDLPPVPVVPKTRTVTLREYSLFEGTSSAVRSWTEIIPGLPWKDTCRTCECEVPE